MSYLASGIAFLVVAMGTSSIPLALAVAGGLVLVAEASGRKIRP